ncbi:MAG: DNA helicase RecQ [Bacteroidaceae bacterium]|nr:DNA helicase RecQ [Bacteroidaceae bacterium]
MSPREALKRYFGYDSFRPRQEEIINCVMGGNDVLVLMPTGGGKSICYQIPALLLPGATVVVSPLISLMKDQVEALQAAGIAACALNSGQTATENERLRRDCLAGNMKLIYMSPETLLAEQPYLLRQIELSLIAVDEAHCVSQWGHDFRPEYTQLGILREKFPGVLVMALTATADKVTRQDILAQLKLDNPHIFISSFDRPNLSLDVKRGLKGKEKLSAMVDFIRRHPGESGIVYCLSRKTTEKLAFDLTLKGFKAVPYHAGLTPNQRDASQTDFIRDDVQIVVATIAFGMGIDKSNVRWVVHYNLPKSIESFYQEIGRSGRDGLPADTLLFYNYADIVQLTTFARESGQRDINLERLDRMREYAEADVCRRRILLNYFGEESACDCGNCDVCQNPPQRFDGTVLAQKALSAVYRAGQQITFQTTIDILRGNYSPAVNEHGYSKLKTFGVGRDIMGRDWQDYLLQILQMGLLEIAYDEQNHLKITPFGESVLYGRSSLQLAVIKREERPSKKVVKEKEKVPKLELNVAVSGDALTDLIFERLRELRRRLADEQGFPPYIIMSDKVLRLLATIRPKTVEEFGNISGIGEFKQRKYGRLLVDEILKNI